LYFPSFADVLKAAGERDAGEGGEDLIGLVEDFLDGKFFRHPKPPLYFVLIILNTSKTFCFS